MDTRRSSEFESEPAFESSQVESINAIAAWGGILVAGGRRPGMPTIWRTDLAWIDQM